MQLPITDVINIYQFSRVGNVETYTTSPVYSNINACITPQGTDIQTSGDVPAYQLFEAFLYDLTVVIHNGDKMVNTNGTVYIVDGVPYVTNTDYLQYIRVLARQVV